MEFKGWLDNLQGWDGDMKSKSRAHQGKLNISKVGSENTPQSSATPNETRRQSNASSSFASSLYGRSAKVAKTDAINHLPGKLMDDDSFPTANSEKDLGNEYFKKKNFLKAVECYSRSIALSPSSVAFANRAMAYLKIKRYKDAEDDCTEALNLDDRYVKAYSRRASARKEQGKLKASLEDSDFALRLEPNNLELKKLHAETKALYDKEMIEKISGTPKSSSKGIQFVENSDVKVEDHLSGNGPFNPAPTVIPRDHVSGKLESRTTVQELAARATSRVMATATKNIEVPKSAYEFEVTWRSLSEDSALQARLLKSIPPDTLPQLFKCALSTPLLVDIVKSIATFYKDDPELAVSILDNLTKVPRFDMVAMCLSSLDQSELRRIWDDTFSKQSVTAEQQVALSKLRSKFCTR